MTTALQTTRLSGKALAAHTEFEAYRRKVAAFGSTKKLGTWSALDLAVEYAQLQARRIDARLDELLAEIASLREAGVSARAKPVLKLKVMRGLDDKVCSELIAKIEAARGRDVKLTIASPGGLVGPAQRLADAIVAHGRCDTHSIVHASSAALLVFAAGRRRSAMQGCRFFLHAPSLDGKPAKTADDQKRLDRCARDMARFLGKRTQQSHSKYLRMMTVEGHTIDAGEASLLGLVNDTVRRPHDPKWQGKRKQ